MSPLLGPLTIDRARLRLDEDASDLSVNELERLLPSALLVLDLEVATGEREELAVGWVVDRLDADNLRVELVIVLVHVLDELELRFRGADDEDLARVGESDGDLVVEALGVRRMLGERNSCAPECLPRPQASRRRGRASRGSS